MFTDRQLLVIAGLVVVGGLFLRYKAVSVAEAVNPLNRDNVIAGNFDHFLDGRFGTSINRDDAAAVAAQADGKLTAGERLFLFFNN